MGVVYLAQDPQIERLLAIKTVRIGADEPSEIADRRERLLREAKTAGRLIHPHVVTLFDAGEQDGTLYLAFEYVEGSNLSERLAGPRPLALSEALRIARETAAGLAFAHGQGIVHRDVKPANLLLATDGTVKISDFGIAKVLGQATELTMTGTVIGSPHYLSPEQVRGEALDGRRRLLPWAQTQPSRVPTQKLSPLPC
jgi:serine/threonine-protein kinase